MRVVFQSIVESEAFWVFVGILCGALIQYFLAYLDRQRQARTALEVLKIELSNNALEAKSFIEELDRQERLLSNGEIEPQSFYFKTQGFDYSALSPLNNSGLLHLLLGADRTQSLFRFAAFFNNRNGEVLHTALRANHSAGKHASFLQHVKQRAEELEKNIQPILSARKAPLLLRLK